MSEFFVDYTEPFDAQIDALWNSACDPMEPRTGRYRSGPPYNMGFSRRYHANRTRFLSQFTVPGRDEVERALDRFIAEPHRADEHRAMLIAVVASSCKSSTFYRRRKS